jgi:hypothetical protein
MAVAGIAKWDVPAAWPELLGQLVGAIAGRRDPRAVHGAVRCLAMFVDELDDAQVVQVGALKFPGKRVETSQPCACMHGLPERWGFLASCKDIVKGF